MDLSSVICVIYYGFFVSILSYVFWFKGIEKIPASNAAVFTSMVPVSSIVLSAVVLKETVMGNIWLDWGVLLGGF
ncbi:EamA family transporter [Robinsoniella sp. KNHs210]|uniref:EamA family transporter n=1 Tax=Robinsoniella sp. KNHs210 TaxID=1469950 RepID=UPI002100B93F|nr:EamA family transporter [Robinsoniella sp. KNHs210]